MLMSSSPKSKYTGRTPQGVRGLKLPGKAVKLGGVARRTPQGVRGLKWENEINAPDAPSSHPARGAWIEILCTANIADARPVAPRKGCVD